MTVRCFPCGQNLTNCYICYDENSLEGFCVDVSDCLSEDYFEFIISHQLKIRYLLLTHGHFDHTRDIQKFHTRFPDVQIAISRTEYENILNNTAVFCEKAMFVEPDLLLKDGTVLHCADSEITVLATPGHSSGSVCFLSDAGFFCGDTVFCGSIGRTDLPTGSFFELMASIQKIKKLAHGKLYPGHMEQTDLDFEIKNNYYFNL